MSASLCASLLIALCALAACSGRIDSPAGGDASGGGGFGGVRAATGGAGRSSGDGGAAAGRSGTIAGADAGGHLAAAAGEGGQDGADGGGGAVSLSADAPLQALQGGAVTGAAHFVENGDTILLTISLMGCPAGEHAVHLHANAACGDNGNAAGGHWSPQGEGVGDVTCGADGAAQFSFTPPAGSWTIGGAAATNILPHAVILHAGPTSEPGARIACGISAEIP